MLKKDKQKVVHIEIINDGFSYESETIPLKEGKFYQYLKDLNERYDDLIIESISEDSIKLTSLSTKKKLFNEDRANEMKDMIEDFIAERLVNVKSYAVFADGLLKGVFAKETLAHLKRKRLESAGFQEVTIQPIMIGSFKDFQ